MENISTKPINVPRTGGFLLAALLFLFFQAAVHAQLGGGGSTSIFGTTSAIAGDTDNYGIFGPSNLTTTTWSVNNGGTVVSSSTTSASIRFNNAGTTTITAVSYDSNFNYYNATLQVGVSPAIPPTPTVTQYCGYTRLTRGSPPTNVTFYWQSSSSGTSTSNSASYVDRSSGSVYYLRGRSTAGLWGAARSVSYSVNSAPGTPSTPSITNNCGSTVLTRGTPPSGVTWYWQSSSSGTSTSNSATSVTRTSGTVYYLRARNNSSGCWSSVRTINYSINSAPGTPSTPSVTNNCESTVLTRGTPPSGITWYWQSSSSGTSTSNSASSVTRTSGTVYYIRARNNSSGCWSSIRSVSYSIQSAPTYYYDTDGDGYGNPSNSVSSCTQPSGTVTNSSDHDDSTNLVTNIAPQTWYKDADGDGYGDNSATLTASFKRLGWATNNTDPCPNEPGTTGCPDAITATTTTTQNFVHTKVFQDTGSGDPIETISYFDGLGRPLQQLSVGASGTEVSTATNTAPGWTNDWTVGSGGTTFFNVNGSNEENNRILAPGPFGKPAIIWECGNDPASDPDGGWKTDLFSVDKTKTYRYTVWVKRNHSQSGQTFHSTQNVDNLTGGASATSDFWIGDLPQLDTWYLLVGIIHPHTHGSTDTGVSGVYDLQGNRVIAGTEFKWGSATTTSRFRSYLYYCNDVNVRQYFHDPMVEIVDGTEKPLSNFFEDGTPKDILTVSTYDNAGRPDKEWLPMSTLGNYGVYRTGDQETATKQYHKDNYGKDFTGVSVANVNAYSEKEYEASPMSRVLKQGAPGYDWRMGGGHEIAFSYMTNAANEVRDFKVTFSGGNTEAPQLSQSGYYAVGELQKNITYDENYTSGTDHSTEEFVDKEGRVVLKRTYENGAHDTYYVYDDFGNLTYVIPPKVTTASVSTTELEELCYQYKYDYRNRLMEKKLPGKDPEEIVYNTLDQPILSRDANLEASGKWLTTKYDAFGRVAYTGMVNSTIDRAGAQTLANSPSYPQYASSTSARTIAGTTVYYSNDTFPTSTAEILTVNYYDDYRFDDDTAFGLTVPTGSILGQPISTNTQGLPTGSKVKVLGTTDWITSITAYDGKGRPIYTASKNNYLNTTDIVETKLDFTGRPIQVVSSHTQGSNPAIVTTDNFTYDHMGRLLTQTQTLGGHTETLVDNAYDQLGQLVEKKVGGGLQTVDYEYNVRGWLSQINNPNSLGNDLFAFGINYSEPQHGGTALYNGNISETVWRTANLDSSPKAYRYGYDALNRIKSGVNLSGTGLTTEFYYSIWGINYDKNGNILNLIRNGKAGTNNSATSIDNLSYVYTGNQLAKVSDTSTSAWKTEGFNDGSNTTTEYTYDDNGNMLTDANKGITSISYNHLNLPTSISINGTGGNGTISYIYDATGVKLKKTVGSSVTEYAGNHIYENGSLQFFNHPEGYVTPDGSGGYDYIYQYKDHLGNVRLSYTNPSSGSFGVILDSDFESSFGGWEENGTVNYSLDNGRLKANVNAAWEGVRHPFTGLMTIAGETLTVKINFDKGNTQSSVRLYLPEYNSSGTVVRWNTLNGNLQTGYGEYTLTMQETGNSIGFLRIDKDNTNTGTETYFFVEDIRLVRNDLEIVEENNYYPFGLKHKGYNTAVSSLGNSVANKWKFGGKEYQDELNLAWYDVSARNYDPALGRWMNLDPLAEKMRRHSPYNFGFDNPVYFQDYDGMMPTGPGKKILKAAKEVAKKTRGRRGRQARLRSLRNDKDVSKADKGWIKQEINNLKRKGKKHLRGIPGKQLVHGRGREAAKGYDYSHTKLNDKFLHDLQHKYDDKGRKNKERPISEAIAAFTASTGISLEGNSNNTDTESSTSDADNESEGMSFSEAFSSVVEEGTGNETVDGVLDFMTGSIETMDNLGTEMFGDNPFGNAINDLLNPFPGASELWQVDEETKNKPK